MGFIYFFSGRDVTFDPKTASEPLREERLDFILEDASLTHRKAIGPNGRTGMLVAVDSKEFPASSLEFNKETQDWKQCGETHWLGTWKGKPPTPASIARPKMMIGEKISLGGQEWTIPLVGPSGVNLPTTWDWDGPIKGGKWAPEVVERYMPLMKLSEEAMKGLRDRDSAIDPEQKMLTYFQFCADLLSVNYRVSNREVGRLKIVGTETIWPIMEAGLGIMLTRREEKKAEEDMEPSG